MTVRKKKKKKVEMREEMRMTERKKKIVNLAYLAEHRISIFLSRELDS